MERLAQPNPLPPDPPGRDKRRRRGDIFTAGGDIALHVASLVPQCMASRHDSSIAKPKLNAGEFRETKASARADEGLGI